MKVFVLVTALLLAAACALVALGAPGLAEGAMWIAFLWVGFVPCKDDDKEVKK